MRVRAEVALVCDRMAEDAESWRKAYRDWTQARARRDEQVRRALERAAAATGGLGLGRWQSALGRRRFRTIEDAKVRAKALRVRPAVQAALAELDRVVYDRGAEVSGAASLLGECSERVASYGELAAMVTGVPIAELHRFTRLAPHGTGPRSTGVGRPR
jgi:hypothetical protein